MKTVVETTFTDQGVPLTYYTTCNMPEMMGFQRQSAKIMSLKIWYCDVCSSLPLPTEAKVQTLGTY